MGRSRRRISFTGMGAEISALFVEENEDANDTQSGLSQAALDGLMVAGDANRREDSPIGDALRRKKRSRVSVGGAGAENMTAVAAETLGGQIPADAPLKSPRKQRGQRKENSVMFSSKAASKPVDKMAPGTPPRQGQRASPLSPLQQVNDLA